MLQRSVYVTTRELSGPTKLHVIATNQVQESSDDVFLLKLGLPGRTRVGRSTSVFCFKLHACQGRGSPAVQQENA